MCTLETHAMLAAKAAAADNAASMEIFSEPVKEEPFCGWLIGHETHMVERLNGDMTECPGYKEPIPQINGY